MNKGIVYKTTGSWYLIRDAAGKMWRGRIRGKLKTDRSISSTNPIAVGDTVLFEVENEGDEERAFIQSVADRENYIVRVSPHNRHQKHIVAANLDLAILVATLSSPRTSAGFIDRFLLTAEMYHIPALIVLNKADELTEKAPEVQRFKKVYESAGYQTVLTNSFDARTLMPLMQKLAGKTALFSGHSGVGKSTLINGLLPGLELRTAEVSGYSGKGQHTTTFAEMFDGPDGSRIIDTPGVKEFGLIDVDKYELAQYFPEFREAMSGCRYNNCLHLEEPGCAVREAVSEGRLPADRYVSYRTILEDLGNHQRR